MNRFVDAVVERRSRANTPRLTLQCPVRELLQRLCPVEAEWLAAQGCVLENLQILSDHDSPSQYVESVLGTAVVAIHCEFNSLPVTRHDAVAVIVSYLDHFSLAINDLESLVSPLALGLVVQLADSVFEQAVVNLLYRFIDRLRSHQNIDPLSLFAVACGLIDKRDQVEHFQVAVELFKEDVSYWNGFPVNPVIPVEPGTPAAHGIEYLACQLTACEAVSPLLVDVIHILNLLTSPMP